MPGDLIRLRFAQIAFLMPAVDLKLAGEVYGYLSERFGGTKCAARFDERAAGELYIALHEDHLFREQFAQPEDLVYQFIAATGCPYSSAYDLFMLHESWERTDD